LKKEVKALYKENKYLSNELSTSAKSVEFFKNKLSDFESQTENTPSLYSQNEALKAEIEKLQTLIVNKDRDWADWNNTLQTDLNLADNAAIKLKVQLSEVTQERDMYRKLCEAAPPKKKRNLFRRKSNT